MINMIENFIKEKEALTYWEINCIQYAVAISLIKQNGTLKNILKTNRNDKKRRWITKAENQINTTQHVKKYPT